MNSILYKLCLTNCSLLWSSVLVRFVSWLSVNKLFRSYLLTNLCLVSRVIAFEIHAVALPVDILKRLACLSHSLPTLPAICSWLLPLRLAIFLDIQLSSLEVHSSLVRFLSCEFTFYAALPFLLTITPSATLESDIMITGALTLAGLPA